MRGLNELFAEGTAPERDAAFAARVEAGINRARLLARLARVGSSVLALALAAAIYLTGRAVAPALARIGESSPEFMGVPAPLVLGALIVGLLLLAKHYLQLRLR